MAVTETETKRPLAPQLVDRKELLKVLDGIREQLDYVVDPSISPMASRKIIEEGMRSRGIDPNTIRFQQHSDDDNGEQP